LKSINERKFGIGGLFLGNCYGMVVRKECSVLDKRGVSVFLCCLFYKEAKGLISERAKELCTTKYMASLIRLANGVTPVWRGGQEFVSCGLVPQDMSWLRPPKKVSSDD